MSLTNGTNYEDEVWFNSDMRYSTYLDTNMPPSHIDLIARGSFCYAANAVANATGVVPEYSRPSRLANPRNFA